MNTENLLQNLRDEEGYRQYVYSDHLGLETIGIGRCIAPDTLGITEEEALYLLKNDVARSIAEARTLSWFDDQPEGIQEIVVHLIFWMGFPRYKLFKKMNLALAQADYEIAALELLDSNLAQQVPGRTERLAERIASHGEHAGH